MTIAPHAQRTAFGDLAEAVETLRDRGLRLTTARRLVLEALFTAEGPASAERIADTQNLDLTSVYRNLETLERHGLARHVHLGHGPGLYVLIGHGEHEYLYCERCGAVRALLPEELDPVRERVRKQFGYEARFTHFAIVGTCPACSGQRPRTHHPTQGERANMSEQPGSGDDEQPHSHEHEHDGTVHEHVHTEHEHDHVEHEHQHSHGDHVHSHRHPHQKGLEDQHEHGH